MVENEKIKPTQEEQYLKRLQVQKEYENGMAIGTVPNMHNINSKVWILFKDISLIHGNNEGAALAACVTAWMSIPSNAIMLDNIHKTRAELESQGVVVHE